MTNKNYSESTIKVGTFFSGIGAPEKAFQKLKDEKIIKDYTLEFFSEIDKNAIKSFCAIHNIDESLNLGSITEIKGENLYSIGPRGVVGRQWVDYAKEKGVNIFTSNKVKEVGIVNIIKEIQEKNKNKKIKFYITFDIDCLDVSYVFGTGTPQCNGLTPYEADEALRNLGKFDICGFDMVELNPKLDDSHSSFVIACELIYHFLAFGYIKK